MESSENSPAVEYTKYIRFIHAFVGTCDHVSARCTIAYQRTGYRADDSGHVEIGISWCSLRDQFMRKKGRELAAQRLLSTPLVIDVKRTGCRECGSGNSFTEDLLAELSLRLTSDEVTAKIACVPAWASVPITKREFCW